MSSERGEETTGPAGGLPERTPASDVPPPPAYQPAGQPGSNATTPDDGPAAPAGAVPPADAAAPASAAPAGGAAEAPESPADPAAQTVRQPAAAGPPPAAPGHPAPPPAGAYQGAGQAPPPFDPAGGAAPGAPGAQPPGAPPQYPDQPPAGGGWGAPPPPFGGPVPEEKGRRRGRGGLVAAVVVTALVAGGVGGGIGAWVGHGGDGGSTTVSSSQADQANLNRSPKSIAGIADKALPSVVTIKAENAEEGTSGTGFVYDKQGHILTNNHVVAPAARSHKLTVAFSDGKSFKASIVGRASGYDVAVIKIDDPGGHKLKPLPIGNSDKVAVGDNAIAIGAPFGLSGTVTTGIVSAKNRPVASSSGESSGTGQASYMNAIQTDASINPGNSGGPLLDANGSVIGIDSAIRTAGSGGSNSPFGEQSQQQSGSIGLGFAIPVNQADRVAQDLIRTGKPVYPVIGVLRNDDYSGNGAEIAPQAIQGTPAVTPHGPADKAGMKPGDVITKLDGVPIDSGPTLVSEIWSHKPGDKVSVTYVRSGDAHTTDVTLGKRVGDS